MAFRKSPAKGKNVRPKPSPIRGLDAKAIDYKNITLLKKFIDNRGKIRPRSLTSVTVQQQRAIARAIKNARVMALLPYVQKNTSKKGGPRHD